MKRSYVAFAIGLLILLFCGFFIWKRLQQTSGYSIDTTRPAIIKQLKTLNRYETSSFTIEKIIEAGTEEGNRFNQLLFGDRLLLIAHGEVIAGFDLSQLKEEDIEILDKKITVNVPAAQILVTRLDSDKTRVYDRTQGWLTQGDKDLETQARMKAEQSIREAACEAGILEEASTKGRVQLETILKTVGFETVVVNIPEGNC